MSRLFIPGKVIQIRCDPLTVKRLVFIETEEHIRHVVDMLKWLFPSASERLQLATELHDIGKKLYLQPDFARIGNKRDSRLLRKRLLLDFYGYNSVGELFTPVEAIERYKTFLDLQDRESKAWKHIKCWIVRQNPEDNNSEIEQVRYQLDPPFGNHAASVEMNDLQNVPEDMVSYIHSLIQLHHSFQVDKLVATAAEHGNEIISDLYQLMTADQEGSRWAEHVVQELEGSEEKPQGKFGFSEFGVEAVGNPSQILRDGNHVQGQVTLIATRKSDLGQKTLNVEYYLSDCDLDLRPEKYLQVRKKKGRKRK